MTKTTATRDQFITWCTIPVRGNDVDARGHVNNATIITYIEGARRDFFHENSLFAEYEAAGQIPVMVTQTCTYRRQLRFPNTVEVGLRLKEVRTRSFTFEYAVFTLDEDTLIAEAHTVHAWMDSESEKAVSLPEDILEVLRNLS